MAADDIGERGRGVRAHGEAEMGGVERDGGLDVVDHVADVHELVRHMCHLPVWSLQLGDEEGDAAASSVRDAFEGG